MCFFFKFISLSFIRQANIKRLQIQSAWRCQHHKDECLRIPLSGRFEDNVPRWVTKHVTEKFFFRFSRVLKVSFISRSFADILPRMMSRYSGGFYESLWKQYSQKCRFNHGLYDLHNNWSYRLSANENTSFHLIQKMLSKRKILITTLFSLFNHTSVYQISCIIKVTFSAVISAQY